MSVAIITDSVSDLPGDVADGLGIAVVPLVVRFGNEEFRDGIDISMPEFYNKIRSGAPFPSTAAPSPADFAACYDDAAKRADEILVITLTKALSGTYDAALQAIDLMETDASVRVLDSQQATMTLGFIAMSAAKAANSGGSLQDAEEAAKACMERVDMLCTFDTLEYLQKGGRIGAARAFLGSILKIHPMIALREGIVQPAGKTRSRPRALERLVSYVSDYRQIDELAIEHTDCQEEAEQLLERLGDFHPREKIYLSTMTPVIGAHTGPGLLLVAVMGDR